MQKNGYFRLNIKNDATYLEVFAPKDGGNGVVFDDLNAYLSALKIYEYDKTQVGIALSTNLGSTEVKLYDLAIYKEDEYIMVNIAEDRSKVTVRFYPPTTGGKRLTKQEIVEKLVQKGVKYGVIETEIEKFIKEPAYCTDIVLAEALKPVAGKDASIEYHFQTDLTQKPKRNEDGSVDFHQLDTISHCVAGDLLATLIPMDAGKPGIDVCGNIIRQYMPKNKVLRHGRNIHVSEDGLSMFSDVNGHVTLVDDQVFVSDTLEIPGDVGPVTGDITYDGNVLVKGSILTGFTVKTKGDVIVEGVVEGATVQAGGQIVLKRGMQGMNKGILIAKGNIISKFFESAKIICGGYISTESILHSDVSAKGDIIVGGKRGFVTGGQIRSGSMIQVKTAGSQMGTVTIMEVGIDPNIVAEYHEAERKLRELKEEKVKCVQIIELVRKKLANGEVVSPDKKITIQKTAQRNALIDVEMKENKEQFLALKNQIDQSNGGMIKVDGTIYQGCKLIISNVVCFIRSEESHCRFERDGADIIRNPF